MAKCMFINNDGGGFADWVPVNDGTTIEEFFVDKMGDADKSAYKIRINSQPCTHGQVIQEGDRVSISPANIKGAEQAEQAG